MNILNKIQRELKAPKGQRNSFGNYNYRSCEDIVEAVKPYLEGATLIINDEIVLIGDRYYVKATASLIDGMTISTASAFAREPLEKKGMDTAQITGATSSYARKYALNGLFAIDDTKDADSTNNSTTGQISGNGGTSNPHVDKFMEDLQPTDEEVIEWKELLESSKTPKEAKDNWKKIPPMVQVKLEKLKDELKVKLK